MEDKSIKKTEQIKALVNSALPALNITTVYSVKNKNLHKCTTNKSDNII